LIEKLNTFLLSVRIYEIGGNVRIAGEKSGEIIDISI